MRKRHQRIFTAHPVPIAPQIHIIQLVLVGGGDAGTTVSAILRSTIVCRVVVPTVCLPGFQEFVLDGQSENNKRMQMSVLGTPIARVDEIAQILGPICF